MSGHRSVRPSLVDCRQQTLSEERRGRSVSRPTDTRRNVRTLLRLHLVLSCPKGLYLSLTRTTGPSFRVIIKDFSHVPVPVSRPINLLPIKQILISIKVRKEKEGILDQETSTRPGISLDSSAVSSTRYPF